MSVSSNEQRATSKRETSQQGIRYSIVNRDPAVNEQRPTCVLTLTLLSHITHVGIDCYKAERETWRGQWREGQIERPGPQEPGKSEGSDAERRSASVGGRLLHERAHKTQNSWPKC